MAFCEYQEKNINLFINQSNDSMYIYNASDDIDKRIKLPFKISIPIAGLYFHNYDSIFVFIDREFVAKMRSSGKEIDDFIIMDSSADIRGRFQLDAVPHIYCGQLEPMIFYSKMAFSGSMIIGKMLYIPFAVYRPRIDDSNLKNLHLKLLCAYNLETKDVKMMNIEIPSKDIGKKFSKGVLTNSFDYYIKDDSTMYISYLYTSEIYKLNLKNNNFELVAQFNQFCFNNAANDTTNGDFRAWFYAPKYSKKHNVFVRKITIDGYKYFKPFSISQVLDEKMNLIGCSFEDSTWTSFVVDSRGEIITNKKDEQYLSYRITGYKTEDLSVEELENRFLVKKHVQQTKSVSIDKTKIGFKARLAVYLNELGISQPVKLVFISSDVICGHCIEFLMNELQNNKEEFIDQNIVYVFYGTNIISMVNIINKYHVEKRFYFLDTENKNAMYFTSNEMQGYPLVICRKNKIDILKTDFSNMAIDFDRFKKKKL